MTIADAQTQLLKPLTKFARSYELDKVSPTKCIDKPSHKTTPKKKIKVRSLTEEMISPLSKKKIESKATPSKKRLHEESIEIADKPAKKRLNTGSMVKKLTFSSSSSMESE